MNWRDKILQEIQNRDGIVILIDPNQIISNDDKILKEINDLEFEIIRFSDSILKIKNTKCKIILN